MADVKISQLPAATTPLDGTELAPIVQSGTTKRVSVANLTVGRALTASSLTLTTPLSAANGGTGLTSLGTGIATFLGTPTSANLAAAVTDETGTGALVFASSPTIATPTLSTSFTSPLHIGGTTASSTLTLQSTSGVGTSDSIVFKVGNNGATTAGVFDTNGTFRVKGGGIAGSTDAVQFSGSAPASAMTLDASGNLGVGGTPASNQRLLVSGGRSGFYANSEPFSLYVQYNSSTNGMYIGSPSANVLSFSDSGGTERMRIDTSGNLLVGTTSAGTSAVSVIGIANGTAPSSSPAGMGQLYVEGGALKYRGSSGTVTTIANA